MCKLLPDDFPKVTGSQECAPDRNSVISAGKNALSGSVQISAAAAKFDDTQSCPVKQQVEYGGESGFVYVQPGTATHPASEVLYNPKNPDAVYRLQMKNGQCMPPQCWPGDGQQNNDVRYAHNYSEYFTPR